MKTGCNGGLSVMLLSPPWCEPDDFKIGYVLQCRLKRSEMVSSCWLPL